MWDLLDRSHEPSIRVQVAAAPIMSLAFNPSTPSASVTQQAAQQLLAVGAWLAGWGLLYVPHVRGCGCMGHWSHPCGLALG